MRTWRLWVALFGLVASVPCEGATGPPVSPYSQAIDIGRSIVTGLQAGDPTRGLSVALYVEGEPIWVEGFGQADVESALPVTPESMFRIASISKNLTGSAVMKLIAEGRLEPDQPIGEYVEGLPPAWRDITTRQLASHSSGIAHYSTPEDRLVCETYATTREAIARFADRPLAHGPGEGETYSSYAYTVLALVIEAVSGESYLDFMRDEIFAPLGIVEIRPDRHEEVIPHRTGYYELDADRRVVRSPHNDLSGRWAGSGFLATARALARFGSLHETAGFLPEDALAELARPQALADGGETREGFGWGRRVDPEGRQTLWGNGRIQGGVGGLLVFPQQRVSIALLSNVRGTPIERGDLEALALPFLATREGTPPMPVAASDAGTWDVLIEGSGQEIRGSLTLSAVGDTASTTDVPGVPMDVRSAFRVEDRLWIMTFNPQVGTLPMRLERRDDDRWAGQLLRTPFALELTRP